MNSLVSNYASDSDSNADSETGVWEEDAIRSQGTVAKLQHTNQATASSLNNNLPVKSLIINNNNNNNNTSTINKSSQKRKREGPVKITLKDLGQQSDEEEYQSDDDDDAQARSSKNKKPADAAGLLGFLPAPKNPSASNQSNSVSSDGIRSKGGVASGDVASSFLNLPQPKSTPMSTIPTSSAFLVPRNLTRDKSTSKKQSLPPSTPSLPKAIPHEEYEDLDFFNLDTTSNDPKNPKRACNNCLQEHSTHGSSNQSTTTPSLNPGVAVHPSTLYSSVYASSSSSATQNHGVQIPVSSSSRNYYSQSATLDRGASGDPNLNPNSSGAQSYGYEYAQHEIDYDGNAIQDSDLDPELVRQLGKDAARKLGKMKSISASDQLLPTDAILARRAHDLSNPPQPKSSSTVAFKSDHKRTHNIMWLASQAQTKKQEIEEMHSRQRANLKNASKQYGF